MKEMKIKRSVIPVMETAIRFIVDLGECVIDTESSFGIIKEISSIVNSQEQEDKRVLKEFLSLAFSKRPQTKEDLLGVVRIHSWRDSVKRGNVQRFIEGISILKATN